MAFKRNWASYPSMQDDIYNPEYVKGLLMNEYQSHERMNYITSLVFQLLAQYSFGSQFKITKRTS